ncbi:replication initiator protein [Apis mellifera associated microvirus 61]|nr:replication initiator protein [Apis mellifera associated microvirus 61]
MCTREITAYQNPSGGRPIFGWEGKKNGLPELKLPCGKCPECCKDYYTSWATRGSRELALWDSTVFITLTYSDEHLPPDNSLNKKDVQDFIKRVKKRFKSTKENPIRQIYCGEYGEKTKRPHYHAILFNCDFADKKPHYMSPQGHQVYTSQTLNNLWKNGFAEFGYAQPGSIAYLFKYVLKKKSRKEKEQPLIIERDGVTYEVAHEFIEASRNPGIGAHMRNSDSIKKGYLTVNGVKKKLSKYYLEWLRKNDPDTFDNISNMKFDFMCKLPKESRLRKEQKEKAQKKLTDTKKKL